MRKIASTTELQHELRRLISAASLPQPSRAEIASALRELSVRVAVDKQAAPRLDIGIESDLDEATTLLLRVKGALADAANTLQSNEGTMLGNPSFKRAYQGAMADVIEAQNALSRARRRFS